MSEQTPVPATVDLSKYIETRFFGERPHIRGRRLLVSMVAANAEGNGWNTADLAHDFGISEEEGLAAVLYYRENKAAIDAQDAEEQKLWDEMYRLHGMTLPGVFSG